MSRRTQQRVLAAIAAAVSVRPEPMPEYLDGPPKVEVVKKPVARKPAKKRNSRKRGK